jgi:3-oxoacyl-[acyl-carrier-protein] synthase-1
MSASIFVTGIGAISAIGNNIAGSLASFGKEAVGIGEISYLNTINQLPVAEVKYSNQELASLSGLSSTISRTALLSMIAAKEALNDAAIENFSSLRTGFISANSVGGMDKSENFFAMGTQKGKLQNVMHHECGSITEVVADRLGISHYVTTISTACSSSANAISFAARMIKHDMLDVAIAGGADALTKFTLNGFNSLMILDQQLCQPFDENRRGLNLGEGAGYIVLVSERIAASLKKAPYCKLSGYANANDAYHQTASSPEGTGPYLAMKNALAQSGLQTSAIDYINLHGTGTQNNDLTEGVAIKRLFGPTTYPKMSSTKSFTGHTLGASGGLEAVFSVLAINRGIIFPNLRLLDPIKELPFKVENNFITNQNIQHVISNSFGFGGNCASLIFSKV